MKQNFIFDYNIKVWRLSQNHGTLRQRKGFFLNYDFDVINHNKIKTIRNPSH